MQLSSPQGPAEPAERTADVQTDSQTSSRRVCVIANPGSGRRDPSLFQQIEDTLCGDASSTGLPSCEVRAVEKGMALDKLARQAVDDGFDVVAAAGGDGTIGAVASAIFDARKGAKPLPHLGIIPLGTFNYVARSLNIPLDDPAAAARVLLTAPPRAFSIGEVNGRVFLNNASLGAYPAILDQREGIYKRWGRSRMAAYWSVIRALSTLGTPLSMSIEVDGSRIRKTSSLAFVAKSAYQIDEFDLPGADEVRKDQFALFVAPDAGRFGLILRAIRLAGRTARLGRDMEMIYGRDVTITTRQKHRLMARDGEKETMTSPFRFRLHPDVLQVVAPPASNPQPAPEGSA